MLRLLLCLVLASGHGAEALFGRAPEVDIMQSTRLRPELVRHVCSTRSVTAATNGKDLAPACRCAGVGLGALSVVAKLVRGPRVGYAGWAETTACALVSCGRLLPGITRRSPQSSDVH
jgi:hypothetical protein